MEQGKSLPHNDIEASLSYPGWSSFDDEGERNLEDDEYTATVIKEN
jgi:hypothetical protein